MTDKPNIEFMPCPFCGGSDRFPVTVLKVESPWNRPVYVATCENCGATGGADFDYIESVNCWNTRADINPVLIGRD